MEIIEALKVEPKEEILISVVRTVNIKTFEPSINLRMSLVDTHKGIMKKYVDINISSIGDFIQCAKFVDELQKNLPSSMFVSIEELMRLVPSDEPVRKAAEKVLSGK